MIQGVRGACRKLHPPTIPDESAAVRGRSPGTKEEMTSDLHRRSKDWLLLRYILQSIDGRKLAVIGVFPLPLLYQYTTDAPGAPTVPNMERKVILASECPPYWKEPLLPSADLIYFVNYSKEINNYRLRYEAHNIVWGSTNNNVRGSTVKRIPVNWEVLNWVTVMLTVFVSKCLTEQWQQKRLQQNWVASLTKRPSLLQKAGTQSIIWRFISQLKMFK